MSTVKDGYCYSCKQRIFLVTDTDGQKYRKLNNHYFTTEHTDNQKIFINGIRDYFLKIYDEYIPIIQQKHVDFYFDSLKPLPRTSPKKSRKYKRKSRKSKRKSY